MAEPVLVIHGVSNRRPERLRAHVAKLQERVGAQFQLMEVFWGDLGAGQIGFEDTVPEIAGADGEEAVTSTPQPLAGLPSEGLSAGAVSTDEERGSIIAAAARPTELETVAPMLQTSILHHLQGTVHLRDVTSPEVLQAVGELIGASAAAEAEAGDLEGIFSSVVERVMRAADRLVGAAVAEALGRFNEAVRKELVPAAARFIGDALAYQHHRSAIQGRIWETIDKHAPGRGTQDAPVHVVAHSLGGVITFHAATAGDSGRQLWIDGFVTFGSQSSLFHTIDPRASGLPAYSPGNPVPVRSIRRWTNLWEPLDPFAFLAGKVFVLEDDGGIRTSPQDVATRHLLSSGVFTHGTYWESDELVDAILSLA